VLLSSGDSSPHLIQKHRSQLRFVTYLLNYPHMIEQQASFLVGSTSFSILNRKKISRNKRSFLGNSGITFFTASYPISSTVAVHKDSVNIIMFVSLSSKCGTQSYRHHKLTNCYYLYILHQVSLMLQNPTGLSCSYLRESHDVVRIKWKWSTYIINCILCYFSNQSQGN
jgi:hypothetical protein